MRPRARAHPRSASRRLAAAVVTLFALPLMPAIAAAATLIVNVQTVDGHALEGAVVTVHAPDATGRRAAPVRAVMDQVNRTFVPDLVVIPVGSTVEFPNSDSVSHQIYSFSPAKRFQLPLYRGKPYPPTRFDQPGIVTLGCNIHDQMLAWVYVTDAPWYGRTAESGAWSTELPRGRYRVALWHPRLRDNPGDLERELTVGDGDRTELTLRLARPLQPAPAADAARAPDY